MFYKKTRVYLRRPAVAGRRRGVALVLVLGMIALLMILGVAFSVTMRTERMSAAFYVHQIRGEHLAHAALTRALGDLAESVAGQVYPDWGLTEDGARVVALGSSGGEPCTDLLTETIRGHIPGILLPQVNAIVANEEVHWREAPERLGQYAYLVINTSGLLDANHAGGQPREYGEEVGEIDISVLDEIASTAGYVNRRNSLIRYETLPEVAHAYGTALKSMNIRPPVPLGRRDPAGRGVFDQEPIGGELAEILAKKNEIIAKFVESGIDNTPGLYGELDPALTQAEIAFYNLVDYIDDDKLPGNLGVAGVADPRIPSVEANPMFNEFEIEYTINIQSNAAGAGWTYVAEGHVRFELAWFFPAALFAGPYTFHQNVGFSSLGGATFAANPPQPQQFNHNVAPPYAIYEADIPRKEGNLAVFPAAAFEIEAAVNTSTRNNGGIVIDTNQTLNVKLPFEFTEQTGQVITVKRGMECIEPRMNYFKTVGGVPNWMETEGPDHETFPSSIGAINERARLAIEDDEATDGHGRFYVSNRSLRSVGELGYLFFGDPWQTIRLYRHQTAGGALSPHMHRVMDNFVISTNLWVSGAVNPNTEIGPAVMAALQGMPYSDNADALTPALTKAQATQIAQQWVTDVRNTEFVKNLSDIGSFSNVFHNTLLAGLNEPQKEALFRNAAALFHPRQNQFTIVIAVSTTGIDGANIGMRRLVAEVWRDPFLDNDGKNRIYLRFFQWVD